MEYILFDVDKIKDYVFDSFKPKEVKGASELIKCLDYDPETKEAGPLLEKLIRETGFSEKDVVYSRGGGGLFLVKNGNIETIRQWMEEHYAEYTRSGSLTAVSHPESNDFPTDFAILGYHLRNRKSEKILGKALEHVEFTEKNRRCDVCGKRPSEEKPKIIGDGEEKVYYCSVCSFKRDFIEKSKGEKNESLEDIITINVKESPLLKNVKETKDILVIYGDLNAAGAHLAAIKDREELKTFSENVFKVLTTKRREIENELTRQGFKFLMPVVGGDDMIIFTHPAAFDSIKDKLFHIEKALGDEFTPKKTVKMNFSFLTAKHNFPINHLFNISEDLLKKTKDAYYNDPKKLTHYGFFLLWEGDYRPSDKDVYLDENFKTLFETAKKLHNDPGIHRSSLHTILELLSEKTGAEREMNMEYFLARHKEFDDYISYENGTLRLICGKSIELSKDAWEDILGMGGLFYKPPAESEEAR